MSRQKGVSVPSWGFFFYSIMSLKLPKSCIMKCGFRPLKWILFLFPLSRTTDTKTFYKPSIGGVRDWNFLTYSILYKTVMIRFLIISAEYIGNIYTITSIIPYASYLYQLLNILITSLLKLHTYHPREQYFIIICRYF